MKDKRVCDFRRVMLKCLALRVVAHIIINAPGQVSPPEKTVETINKSSIGPNQIFLPTPPIPRPSGAVLQSRSDTGLAIPLPVGDPKKRNALLLVDVLCSTEVCI